MKRMVVRAAGIALAPFGYVLQRWRRRRALRMQRRAEALLEDVRSALERSRSVAEECAVTLRWYEDEVRQIVASLSCADPDWTKASFSLAGMCEVIGPFRDRVLKKLEKDVSVREEVPALHREVLAMAERLDEAARNGAVMPSGWSRARNMVVFFRLPAPHEDWDAAREKLLLCRKVFLQAEAESAARPQPEPSASSARTGYRVDEDTLI